MVVAAWCKLLRRDVHSPLLALSNHDSNVAHVGVGSSTPICVSHSLPLFGGDRGRGEGNACVGLCVGYQRVRNARGNQQQPFDSVLLL